MSGENSTAGKGVRASASGGTRKRGYACNTCLDWGTVSQTSVLGNGVTQEQARPCPDCQPVPSTPQRALDRATGQVGIVMWSGTVLGPEGLVTKYALRPEGGGVEWPATDVELLNSPFGPAGQAGQA